MHKKIIIFLVLLTVALTAYAAGVPLKQGHPTQYVVKKGDTLWDIAGRFISKPWEWPKIWHANPQIDNPHWIYPGDVLNLVEGKYPVIKLAPSVHVDKTPINTISLKALKPYLEDIRVVAKQDLDDSPYVMAMEENRLRAVTGDYIYARNLKAEAGDVFDIVRTSHRFRQYSPSDAKTSSTANVKTFHPLHAFSTTDHNQESNLIAHDYDSNVEQGPAIWRENTRHDKHHGYGRDLGMEVKIIGTAKMIRNGDPASLVVIHSNREIRKGDRLLPVSKPAYDDHYFPHPPQSIPKDAHVIALAHRMYGAGDHDIVALSVGKDDGVDNGTMFSAFRPGQWVHDDVAGYTMHSGWTHRVQLPGEFAGNLMVFRTFKHVSYAIAMHPLKMIRVGSELRMPE